MIIPLIRDRARTHEEEDRKKETEREREEGRGGKEKRREEKKDERRDETGCALNGCISRGLVFISRAARFDLIAQTRRMRVHARVRF